MGHHVGLHQAPLNPALLVAVWRHDSHGEIFSSEEKKRKLDVNRSKSSGCKDMWDDGLSRPVSVSIMSRVMRGQPISEDWL